MNRIKALIGSNFLSERDTVIALERAALMLTYEKKGPARPTIVGYVTEHEHFLGTRYFGLLAALDLDALYGRTVACSNQITVPSEGEMYINGWSGAACDLRKSHSVRVTQDADGKLMLHIECEKDLDGNVPKLSFKVLNKDEAKAYYFGPMLELASSRGVDYKIR